MRLRPAAILACAISGALMAIATGVAAQPRAGVATPADHRTAATRLRPVDPARRVSVSIALRHDRRGLEGQLLTGPSQRASLQAIVRRHGARTGDIRTVVRWARAKGLTARPGGLRTRVVVRGPAGRISQAFGVRLHHYGHRGADIRRCPGADQRAARDRRRRHGRRWSRPCATPKAYGRPNVFRGKRRLAVPLCVERVLDEPDG